MSLMFKDLLPHCLSYTFFPLRHNLGQCISHYINDLFTILMDLNHCQTETPFYTESYDKISFYILFVSS